jgi:hypothetical protein
MSAAEWLERESLRRAPLYEEVAGVIVDVETDRGTDRPIADVVAEIRERIGR